MIIDNELHEYIQGELDNPESKNNISEDEPEIIILKKIVADIKRLLKDERRNAMTFIEEDKYWFEVVKNTPTEYQIIIDYNSVWVETDNENGETICVYTFSSYGYQFIYGLLNYLGINADIFYINKCF